MRTTKRFVLAFVLGCGGALALVSCDGSRAPTPPSSVLLPPGPTTPVAAESTTVSWACLTAPPTFRPSSCATTRVSSLSFRASAVAPALPTNLTGSVTGNRVTLTWTPPLAGDVPSSYTVEAGSSFGLADLANFDTGSPLPSLTVDDVPAGTYYVRVRSKNSAGMSGASNEIQLRRRTSAVHVGPGSANGLDGVSERFIGNADLDRVLRRLYDDGLPDRSGKRDWPKQPRQFQYRHDRDELRRKRRRLRHVLCSRPCG